MIPAIQALAELSVIAKGAPVAGGVTGRVTDAAQSEIVRASKALDAPPEVRLEQGMPASMNLPVAAKSDGPAR